MAALAVVGPLGQTANGGLARGDHGAGVVVLRLLPEEGIRLHVEGKVAVVTCGREEVFSVHQSWVCFAPHEHEHEHEHSLLARWGMGTATFLPRL